MNLNRVSASNRPAVKNDFKKRNGSRERDSFYNRIPIIPFQEKSWKYSIETSYFRKY